MKATAYLLDTEVWSGFGNSTYTDYAVGGPTLELFTASYNATHETDIDTQVSDSSGYELKWSTAGNYTYKVEGLDTTENLYINDSTYAGEWGYWIASPMGKDAPKYDSVLRVDFNGDVCTTVYDMGFYGARPLVSLKSNVQLIEQENGRYSIVTRQCRDQFRHSKIRLEKSKPRNTNRNRNRIIHNNIFKLN